MRRALPVVEQRRPVARRAALEHPLPKRRALGNLGQVGRAAQAAGQGAPQVVRDAAAAEYQHAAVLQRRQGRPQRELLRRAVAGHEGERQHRNVGVRVQVAQHRPDAVVEPALRHHRHAQAGLGEQRRHVLRKVRRARGVVAQCVELRVEIAEVVHRRVAWRRQQQRRTRRGVGRDRQDGRRAAEQGVDRRAEALHEGTGGARLQRDHRRAVGDEDRRMAGVHWQIEAPTPSRRVAGRCTQRSVSAP